jgi:hypothetical protein
MDRSLNGDDFRLFAQWEREDFPERFETADATTDQSAPEAA